MNCLYFMFFVCTSYCAHYFDYLTKDETSFFDLTFFTRENDNALHSRANMLAEMGSFDFRIINTRFSRVYEGVVFYKGGRCEFLKKTAQLNFDDSAVPDCFNKISPCGHCSEFQSKLRNGVFYCGDYRVCKQDEQGNVLIEQYTPDGQKESARFLFGNFEKIIRVEEEQTTDLYYFVTDESDFKHRVIYNYELNTKLIKQSSSKGEISYLKLETFYEEKYPWMTKKFIEPIDGYTIQDGDLVIESVKVPFWLSLYEKITFCNFIVFYKDYVCLRTQDGRNIAFGHHKIKMFFSITNPLFFSITNPPDYDAHNLSWIKPDPDVCFVRLEQSLWGPHLGPYLLALKNLFLILKNRFMRIYRNQKFEGYFAKVEAMIQRFKQGLH